MEEAGARRERIVNEEKEKPAGNNGEEGRRIEKQFTRKSALDLSVPRRLFLIGVSCCIADGFCVLSRMLFILPAGFVAIRRERSSQVTYAGTMKGAR